MPDDQGASEEEPENDNINEESSKSPNEKQKRQREEDTQAHVSVSGGRRRGRRRVTKKKTIKDEEGYLGNSITPFMQLSSHNLYSIHKIGTDETLMYCSYQGRSCMGIFLRRRAGAKNRLVSRLDSTEC